MIGFAVVKGWGVWIETLELTDVTISSDTLFRHMQSGFREAKHLEAETQRLDTAQRIREIEINQGMKDAAQQAQLQSKKAELQHQQQQRALELAAERTNLEAAMSKKKVLFKAEQQLLQREKLEEFERREHEMETERMKRAHAVAMLQKKQLLELEQMGGEHDRAERSLRQQLCRHEATNRPKSATFELKFSTHEWM